MAYDIIVNIIPVLSGTLQCQGPWPAFAGQPHQKCIYILIRSYWIITAMSIWKCRWLGWESAGLTFERFRVRVLALSTIWMVFYIFSWANHIFYKDYDIIGKLWTYHNEYTRCYIKDLTYEIIVNIIVNIIYDIIGMLLIMISYVKIWYHSKYQTYDIIVLLWYHYRLWYHMFGLWYHTSYHS